MCRAASPSTVTLAATIAATLLGVCLASCSAPPPSSLGLEGRADAATPSDPPPHIRLPAPRTQGEMSLEEAIRLRRSVRAFAAQTVPLSHLGQLLWAAQGLTSGEGGRAAPSAGATYPLRLYCVAGLIEGLAPGLYLYDETGHHLRLVTEGDMRQALAHTALGQECVAQAPLSLVITAVYQRTTAVYGERGRRYVHLEAGHAAQNVHLQAVALGLGSVPVGAFSDEQLGRLLRLPSSEAPLYIVPVGFPAAAE